ncbi:MAG: sulfotransferase family protein, partial [Rhodanobacteraceae bacterium]
MALYNYLASHPQVLRPSRREIEFFSHYYVRGLDWYRAHFPLRVTSALLAHLGKGRKVISGESSPFYLPHPKAAERIATTVPGVRLIVLLREPVARAYSHYMHELRNGHENLSFEEAVATEDQRVAGEMGHMQADLGYHSIRYCRHAYVRLGEYIDQLKPYLKLFSRDQILAVRSEDLFIQPQNTLDQVTDFLGLGRCAITGFKKMNSQAYAPLSASNPQLVRKLEDHYRPYNTALYDELGVDFHWWS